MFLLEKNQTKTNLPPIFVRQFVFFGIIHQAGYYPMVSLFQNFSWVKFFYLDHPGSMILRYYHIASTIIQAMDVGNARPLAGWWRGTGADGQWKRTGPSAPGEPIGFLFRVFLPLLKVGFRISKPKFLMGICEITDVTHEHRCRRQISFYRISMHILVSADFVFPL